MTPQPISTFPKMELDPIVGSPRTHSHVLLWAMILLIFGCIALLLGVVHIQEREIAQLDKAIKRLSPATDDETKAALNRLNKTVEPKPEPKPLVAFTDGKAPGPVLIVLDTGAVIKVKELPIKDYAAYIWRDMDLIPKDKLKDGKFILVPFPNFGMEINVLERTIRLLPDAPADLKSFWAEIARAGQTSRAKSAAKK